MFAGTQTINIGQDASCHFSLSGEYISKYHATIVRQGSSWYLEDHSTNGTYVNGARIQKDVPMSFPAGTVLQLADGSNEIKLG